MAEVTQNNTTPGIESSEFHLNLKSRVSPRTTMLYISHVADPKRRLLSYLPRLRPNLSSQLSLLMPFYDDPPHLEDDLYSNQQDDNHL